MREKQRPREWHAVLRRSKLGLLPTPISVNFCSWKWACKTRRWRPRPRPLVFSSRRDREFPRFSRDETETFQNSVWRLRDRDFMAELRCWYLT